MSNETGGREAGHIVNRPRASLRAEGSYFPVASRSSKSAPMIERLRCCCVKTTERIIDALRALDQGAIAIALVVDEGDRLVGILTDGDIRRALLAGVPLDGSIRPHVKRDFTSVGPQTMRVEVLELMQARSIEHVPVIDESGRLLGLHLLHDVLKTTDLPTWAVIMAGGKGTRLGSITQHVPKPMLSVAGRPILERLVLHLGGFGIRRVFLAINYLGHLIEEHFGDGSRFGCRIDYLREDTSLGTGGALGLLPEVPQDPLVVMNGDLVTQADIGAMLAFHAAGGQCATMGVRRYFHTVPFGCVEVEADRIVTIEEKPELRKLVNAGIYVLSPGLLPRVPRGQPFGLPTLLEAALARGECVRAFEIQDDWIDVGQREHLKLAREGEA
ncbi:MAG: sugar phosphate nucleotidyltransferase [Polyangiaceae bacterium]